ncbi:MAG: hypothetical protein ACJZ4I_03825 [Candidatus Pelagibacter sp.]
MKKTYIFFFITVLFLNFATLDTKASIFKVNDIEVSEPFELNFNKYSVIDRAFVEAFNQLSKMIVLSDQAKKIKSTKISEIKNLIDSFNIKNEKFIQNYYSANFEVNFNKQNTLLFFEKKNIFPSIPRKKNILIFPILIDLDLQTVNLFNQNPFFKEWALNKKNYHLLNYILPNEDIDVISELNKNINNLEDFNYENIVKKYNSNEYIISLIYKENNNIKIFSKIKINNNTKIHSYRVESIDISKLDNLNDLINEIKNIYEDNWKLNNQINRSVKLPINISIISDDYNKNMKFESFLKSNELIAKFFVKDFNNQKINYKVIFNGSPKQFLKIISNNGININTSKQIWEIN